MAQKEQHPAAAAVRKSGPVSSALDKVFHFTERGSTMKSEIGAGLGSFCIAVCALLMNTQIIGSAYGNYAGSYLAVGLLCFAGTLLLGIICNLPLQQTANMGLSSVLISMLGTDTGLTYANLMAVTFVAAVVYLALVLSPARRVLVDALPDGVKKALPVGIGLYIMYTGLKNAGILNAEGAMTRASDLTTLNIYYFWLMIAAVFLFILFKALRRKKPAFATFGILIGAMWIGGIIFFMDYFIGGQTASVVVYERLNLVVATDGVDGSEVRLQDNSVWNWKVFELFLCFEIRSAFDNALIVNLSLNSGSLPPPEAAKREILVDRFGQSTRADWPGKVKQESDFVRLRNEEEKYHASLPPVPGQDRFGGLAGSREKYGLKATGFFRTDKVAGRDVLVTPDGNLFFMLAAAGLGMCDSITKVEGREDSFEWLPKRSDGQVFYIDGKHVSFYKMNLLRKWGFNIFGPIN